jgi:hypothetical protein
MSVVVLFLTARPTVRHVHTTTARAFASVLAAHGSTRLLGDGINGRPYVAHLFKQAPRSGACLKIEWFV